MNSVSSLRGRWAGCFYHANSSIYQVVFTASSNELDDAFAGHGEMTLVSPSSVKPTYLKFDVTLSMFVKGEMLIRLTTERSYGALSIVAFFAETSDDGIGMTIIGYTNPRYPGFAGGLLFLSRVG